jgi:anti-sigma regulatory factor (Ser/Thr protein kinase)
MTRVLDGGRGFALALRPDQEHPEAHVTMGPRSTLLLYTDGLVERRRASLDTGIMAAAEVVRAGRSADLDQMADDLMSGLEPDGGYQDDVALLLYRQPGPLEMAFPAHTDQLAPSRSELRGWLGRVGVDPEQVQNVLIAVGEAVSNAIEHGHRNTPDGTVTLRACAYADQLRVTIRDTGTWKENRPGENIRRGRGLALMRGLMDDFSIHSDPGGTTVDLYARIP